MKVSIEINYTAVKNSGTPSSPMGQELRERWLRTGEELSTLNRHHFPVNFPSLSDTFLWENNLHDSETEKKLQISSNVMLRVLKCTKNNLINVKMRGEDI